MEELSTFQDISLGIFSRLYKIYQLHIIKKATASSNFVMIYESIKEEKLRRKSTRSRQLSLNNFSRLSAIISDYYFPLSYRKSWSTGQKESTNVLNTISTDRPEGINECA